ncbi:hypothetical protein G3N95_08940 [Paraburkholderia sp. Tr-20389]|uniref:cysteine peptidase family C39 domain-containing protein n=1 Tax=Paraburkholderia sp. Tr-20389 TaxID=2703903 RepID=UPI00197DF359|nr:cysteine peptidase family C39 domain-containing protein [Paraburkholderia sp. Tr-20389]MBN3753068.1 hypothetical protein [Paraburkholderia sp. Tr-20389]
MNAPDLGPDSHASDPGLAALVVIARFHSIAADGAQLRHASGLGNSLFDTDSLVLSARTLGMKARKVSLRPGSLSRSPLPALVLDRDGGPDHRNGSRQDR